MGNELSEIRLPPLAPVAESEAAQVLAMIATAARDPSIDVVKLEKLFELRERVASAEARRSFNIAIANAKAEIGPIFKDKEVDFTSQKGRTNYRHETFGAIARAVDPVLGKYGLSYRFRPSQETGRVRMTCIVSHRDGYFEESTLESPEDHSGNKNPIQAIGSASQYLQRYTLRAALGLSTTEHEDDGRGAFASQDAVVISDEQCEHLMARIIEVGADVDRFYTHFRIQDIHDFPAKRFGEAMQMLDDKARRDQKGQSK